MFNVCVCRSGRRGPDGFKKEGGLFVAESYREEKRHSTIIRVGPHTDEVIVDA